MGRLTNTVSGDIASFKSCAGADIKSLKCYFSPILEGSGDPSPSNVREISGWNSCNIYIKGKNLFNKNTPITFGSYTDSGTYVNSDVRLMTDYIPIKVGITYTVSLSLDNIDSLVLNTYHLFDENKNWIGNRVTVGESSFSNSFSHTFNISLSNAKYIRIVFKDKNNNNILSKTLLNAYVQLEIGSTATSLEPYLGQTIPVTLPSIGKNKLDMNFFNNKEGITYSNNTAIGTGSNFYNTTLGKERIKLYIPANTPFSFSCNAYTEGNESTSDNGLTMVLKYEGSGSKRLFIAPNSTTTNTLFTFSDTLEKPAVELAIGYWSAPNNIWHISNMQLELSSSVTTYEAYSSNNIIYGGYIDLALGKLVLTCKLLTITGSEINASYSWKSYTIPIDDTNTADNNGNYNIIACSHTNKKGYGSEAWANSTTSPMVTFSLGHYLRYRDLDNFSDLETAQSYLQTQYNAGTPIQAVVKLITPIEYYFTPYELLTLVGQNNIWSTTNEQVEVEYDLHETKDIVEAKKRVLLALPHLAIVSDSIAHFNTNATYQLKECKVNFLPILGGSGDSSPTNIRSIAGWTGINLYHTQENLINLSDLTFINNTSNIDLSITNNTMTFTLKKVGTNFVNAAQEVLWTILPALQGKEVYMGCTSVELLSSNNNHKSTVVCEFRDSSGAFISDPTIISYLPGGSSNTLVRKVTIPSNAVVAKFFFRLALNIGTYNAAIGDSVTFNDFYIRYPIDTDNYIQYLGNTIAIDWTSNGTIYGGYVDLINGKLVQTWNIVQIKNCAVGLNSNSATAWHNWHVTPPNAYPMTLNFTDFICPIMCDTFTAITLALLTQEETNPIVWASHVDGTFRFKYATDCALTATEFKAKYGEMTVAYKLATPIECTLTPQQISAFKGTNNFWSNTNGDLTIKYWTH